MHVLIVWFLKNNISFLPVWYLWNKTFVVSSGILVIRVTPDTMRADSRPVEATGSERAGMNMAWLISHGRDCNWFITAPVHAARATTVTSFSIARIRALRERRLNRLYDLKNESRLCRDKTIQITDYTCIFIYIHIFIYYSNIHLYETYK